MGTEDADTEDEGDEGNPPADSPVQPDSWPFYEQLLFLRDTMTFRETSGNFESQRKQRKDVQQVARQETPETLFRDMCPSQFDTIELNQTDDPVDLYPAPAVSVECSPSLLEPGMSSLEATQSSESAPSPLGTASALGLAATSLESQGSSLASMSVMQPPKKRRKKDDNDSLLVEHLGKLTNSLEDQDDHHYFALSLVKSMRKVKEEDHLRMRMKILEVIQQFNSS
ncbi:uncharacterized protein LOC119168516 [Rhipicephalus microplus]|uniref:uncharacterized protein LOC119168516 n=1 Tax=Rhipicephalus microplus TaxID=6941 RepID=UPI003F6D5186